MIRTNAVKGKKNNVKKRKINANELFQSFKNLKRKECLNIETKDSKSMKHSYLLTFNL